MDPLTQGLFGGLIGQAGFRKSIGPRAAVAGALIALTPDLDIFWPYASELAAWVHHRGITHSLLTGPFFGMALGGFFWAYWRWRGKPAPLTPCLWLGLLAFITHAGLDLFTPYGTQLLAPLAATRFAIPALPVIDLTYSLILLIALAGSLLLRHGRAAQSLAVAGILGSVLWQTYGWHIQIEARQIARADLAAQSVHAPHIEAWPLLLQPWARRIAAEGEAHYYLALWSPLSRMPPVWQVYEKQAHPFAAQFANAPAFRLFYRFTSGHMFWRVYAMPDGDIRLEAHDLRYMNNHGAAMESLWALGAQFAPDGSMRAAPRLVFNRPDRAKFFAALRGIVFGPAP